MGTVANQRTNNLCEVPFTIWILQIVAIQKVGKLLPELPVLKEADTTDFFMDRKILLYKKKWAK